MLEPFIFIGIHRIKDGMLEEYKRYTCELVEAIEASEPRLIALHAGDGYAMDRETAVSYALSDADWGARPVHRRSRRFALACTLPVSTQSR
jgi:hypothetical protein